jgi:hypothetical protein
MSTVERNKGVLIATDIDTEHFTEEDFETYSENGFVIIDNEIYEVQWEVQRETDCDYFVDVEVNKETGSIYFHTMHYNGGAHWTEVVERALK